MKVKLKGTRKALDITPTEWAKIEKQGQANEYEIIERKTVWAAPLDPKSNEPRIDSIREFEIDHWNNLLSLGSRNTWRKIENRDVSSTPFASDRSTPLEESEVPEISKLQVELTSAQIDKTKAEIKLITEQTVDLRRKWKYFILGFILGVWKDILEWIQAIWPKE